MHLRLAEQVGAHLGPQALEQQQVYPAGEQEVFVADGAHKVLQHPLAGRVGPGQQKLLVRHQQHLAGGRGHHRYRAGKARAAQHVAEHTARPHLADGQTRPAGGGMVGLDGAGEHHAHPAVRLSGQYEGLAPAVGAQYGPHFAQQDPERFGFQPGEQRGGL